MNPLRLRASSYRTFGDLDVTFDHGLTGILGELRDAPEGADSNGAGKSSILEGIDIALFGRRSLAGYLTRGGASTELMLELTFEHAREIYRVRRSYSARGRGKSTVDFERDQLENASMAPLEPSWEPLTCESTKETQALIEATIGLSHATFCNSSYLRQGDGSYADPARDPAERKKLLAEAALGRDPVWPRALEAAKRDRKQAEQELQRLAGVTDQLRATVEQQPTVVTSLDTSRTDAAATHAELQAVEARIVALEERYRGAAELAGRRQALQAELAAARAALEQLQLAHVTATEAVTALAASRAELATFKSVIETDELVQAERDLLAQTAEWERAETAHVTALQQARTAEQQRETLLQRETEARERFETIRDAIRDLEQAPHGEAHCDRCGQVLAGSARALAVESMGKEANGHAQAADQLKEEAAAVAIPAVPAKPAGEPPTAALADVRRALATAQADLQQRARLEERISQLQRAIDSRPTHKVIEQATAMCLGVRAELDEIEPVDLDAIKREGEQARARVTELRQFATTRDAIVARHEAALERIVAAAAELATVTMQRTTLQKVVDECIVIERAFGRDGVPALILENRVIPQLETEATRILSELGTGYQVELRTQQATKDGGLRDTLEVVIVDETGEAPYDDFSGGEQTRIGLALRIALARLLAQRRGAESRLLALDEPSYLDQAGMTALLDVLRRLQDDFDTILLVSHVPELRDALDQTLVVIKDSRGSRIEGASEPVEAVAL